MGNGIAWLEFDGIDTILRIYCGKMLDNLQMGQGSTLQSLATRPC